MVKCKYKFKCRSKDSPKCNTCKHNQDKDYYEREYIHPNYNECQTPIKFT